MPTNEHRRLSEIRDDFSGWRRWGPYVSDRSWATVREDYSETGDAWGHLPHDLVHQIGGYLRDQREAPRGRRSRPRRDR